jgi:hypothetical protein
MAIERYVKKESTGLPNWLKGMTALAMVLGIVALVGLTVNSLYSRDSRLAVVQGISSDMPETFSGTLIDLTGTVTQTIGAQAVVVETPGIWGNNVLVIMRDLNIPIGGGPGEDYFYTPNDQVELAGKIRRFHTKDIEQLLSIDLDDEEFMAWQGKPVVIADTVRPIH